jgi:transcriptional regulator
MYLPASFREERLDVLHDVIRRNSFATLVTDGEQGPFATHLPILLDATRGPFGTLRAHVARANPHWRLFASGKPSLAMFQGPHAYISPSWYASTTGMVPTWNYVAVHAYGIARVIENDDELRRLLIDTVGAYESSFAKPWTVEPQTLQNMMRGVVGFEIPIDRLEGKAKLGQNRTDPDRRGAIDALSGSGDAGGAAVAELMRQALDGPDGAPDAKSP